MSGFVLKETIWAYKACTQTFKTTSSADTFSLYFLTPPFSKCIIRNKALRILNEKKMTFMSESETDKNVYVSVSAYVWKEFYLWSRCVHILLVASKLDINLHSVLILHQKEKFLSIFLYMKIETFLSLPYPHDWMSECFAWRSMCILRVELQGYFIELFISMWSQYFYVKSSMQPTHQS